ncbi:hypothetical protein CWI38_0165p0030 [Hamiltosporidium tvaerminnensis]|uniref:Uncharacterized protein n=1 Tax=Hamiltosporidium tvaerminnensis TaxID=1176355 RepID=A0A4Q9M316_9MICR|nr:hypothetical protein CWI38_0165p0030 [Hamiltosporidium tvaerminnensis]
MCFRLLEAINLGILLINLTNLHICTLSVNFIAINDDEKPNITINNIGVYFLDMKKCLLLEISDMPKSLLSLNCINTNKRHLIVYPNDTFLEFKFLKQNIIKKYKKITIYMSKNDFTIISYFWKLLKAEDSIVSLDANVFFEILKYLNIFNVKRNKKYKSFINSLVIFTVMKNQKRFLEKSAEFMLNSREYNSFNILDIIESIFKFYLIKKLFVHVTFHEYIPISFLKTRYTNKKLKKPKNCVSMQFENFYFLSYFYRCLLLDPILCNIWILITKILYIDKLYIDFSILNEDIDIEVVFGSLAQNINKFSMVVLEKNLPILDKLKKYGHLDFIKNLKLYLFHSSIFILKTLPYFNSLEKLTLEFSEIKIYEICNLENLSVLENIKYIKIILCKPIDIQSKISSHLLLGCKKNLFVDLSGTLNLSDSGNSLRNFLTFNFKNYIIGIALKPNFSNLDNFNLTKILHYNLITRLRLNLENIEAKLLENYSFLKYFKLLSKLHFIYIMLTNDLLRILLKLDNLKYILFECFQISEPIESENLNYTNKCVIYIEFNTLFGSLDNNFLCFIARFIGLKHLSFDMVTISYSPVEIFVYNEIENLSVVSKYKRLENRPKLEFLQYSNEIKYVSEIHFSVLYLFSLFFDLQNLKELIYKSYYLNIKDVTVFENFKKLTCLELSIKENDIYLYILQKILESRIKKTIFKLDILVNKFNKLDLIAILYFKKLKILKLGAKISDENDKQNFKFLCRMNTILSEIFVSTDIQEVYYS